MGVKQIVFSDYEQTTSTKRTRKEKFLAEIDQVVSWQPLLDLNKPICPKVSSKAGRPSYPLATMPRIHLMQQWCSLSYPAMEDALIEVPTLRSFAEIDLISDKIPDETTILSFRHLLEKNKLGKEIFDVVKAHLKQRGMAMKQCTLISAPSSTKNKTGERDPEMHQTEKSNQWYFGMKVQIGIDKDSGLPPGLIQSSSQASLPGLSAWVEVG